MDIISLLIIPAILGGVELHFEGIPRVELSFDLGDLEPEWALASKTAAEATYAWKGFALTVRAEPRGSARLLRVRLEPPAGSSLRVLGYEAKVAVPLAGLHAVMVPNTQPIAHTLIYFHEHKRWPESMKIHRCLIPKGFRQSAATNAEAPFIQLTDSRGHNKVVAGWTAAERSGELKGEAEGDLYVLTLSRREDVPFGGAALEDALFLSTESGPWWPVVRSYAGTFNDLNGRRREPSPAWATDPVFCTWYCYLDHIDQAGVLRIARKCKELGFGTILIDAGWDCRPDGGYADFERGLLGDFTAMPDRFPDLPGAIREIHEMGLKVELWSAPFWQGKGSRAYREKTGDWHVRTPEGEDRNLCPRYVGTRDYLKERFAWVARTYGIDGMWLDAADGVPPRCEAKHEHRDLPMGAAFVDCLAAIREGLRSVNPQAVTEARVLHANLNTERALDVVQPSDAPESFEVLRLAGIHMRAWARGAVLKNDPMFWKKDAGAATVGKFLATMVCNGVPALSVDFLTAPEEQCRQTAAWLSFYRRHKETLLGGEFVLFGADPGSPDMLLAGKDEAVVSIKNPLTREVPLPRSAGRAGHSGCRPIVPTGRKAAPRSSSIPPAIPRPLRHTRSRKEERRSSRSFSARLMTLTL
jgi:alpha-galactosidase